MLLFQVGDVNPCNPIGTLLDGAMVFLFLCLADRGSAV